MKIKNIRNFITSNEVEEIIQYSPPKLKSIDNDHIKKVNEATNGWSILCDLTQTSVSKEVAKFQGDNTLVDKVPSIFHNLADRISSSLSISKEHVFFQYIVVGKQGEVKKHYDAGKPGFVTYKCNICVDGPELDVIYVDRNEVSINKLDLYCFEANFYKHWMNKNDCPRIHLSYGFLIPYVELGWSESDPRVRLSNRIWRAYIGNK